MKWVGFFSLEIGQPKYLLPLVLSSIVGGVTGYKSIFYPTIISCSLAGQIRTSKCHSADVIFMLTSRLCLTLSRLWIPKMCVGIRLPWTVKDADAVVLTVCCIYACVACICACSSISSHIWFNSLSHVPSQDHLSSTRVLLPASWHCYSPTPLFSSFSTSICVSPPLFPGL